MKIFNLKEFQYGAFVDSIKSYLSKTLSGFGSTYGNNTVFGQLINVVSNIVQSVMLYIEDALVEQNRYTAQRKKSIFSLAQLSGYNPDLGHAATAIAKITFKPTNESNLNVIINNKEKILCVQNGLTYNIMLPQEAIVMSLEKDSSTKHLTVVEGVYETQTFVSSGGSTYSINFKFTGNLDIDYVEVRVNNELWSREVSLYDMAPDSMTYVCKSALNGGLDIIFGNDEHGRALENGDIITVTYLIHDGESGNINLNEDLSFLFVNPLTNIAGESVDGNNVLNIIATKDGVTSGSNSEDMETVRQMIGMNSRSLVLSSPENYKQYINHFSFCGYNHTWSEAGSMIVNSLIIKNYKQIMKTEGRDYFSLTEKDFILSDAQKISVKNSINNSGNQLAGVVYNIFDPDICKYALYIYITLKNASYDTQYIETQIRNLIGEFMTNIDRDDKFIPKSDISNLIMNNVEGVDGVNMYFISEKNETAIQEKQYENVTYTYNLETGSYEKTTETVHLYNGEDPGIGLDSHGNIYLQNNEQFPVLMGGWDFLNDDGNEVAVIDPLTIIFS